MARLVITFVIIGICSNIFSYDRYEVEKDPEFQKILVTYLNRVNTELIKIQFQLDKLLLYLGVDLNEFDSDYKEEPKEPLKQSYIQDNN